MVTSNLIDNLKVNGNISIIDPLIDDRTRTFKIIGVIENKNEILKPGMMINLKLLFSKRETLLLRESSVFNQDNISYVYLVDNQNKILKKQIEIGVKFDGLVEILSGIEPDDFIVYEGINKIRDGSIVKLNEFFWIFYKKPVFCFVLASFLILVGYLSLKELPLRQFPDIERSEITIDTTYPGASSGIIETKITELIEAQISGIDGMNLFHQ